MKAAAPHPAAFDRTLSLRLDALILSIEQRPAWPRAAWLRTQKRIAERCVPAYQSKAGAS